MVYENQILSVSQLNLFVKDILGQIPLLNNIKIKGEISNFKHHSSGHMYMSLKDPGGVLKAVMFKTNNMALTFKPENGMQVVAQGRISVYERDGQYQLYITSMEQDGKGNLYEQFEKLKAKLNAEGLFDQSNKKPIPRFPRRIGVITAPTGAAVRDIINILSRRYTAADICLFPALVQGTGAAESISRAIEYFNNSDSADVLIVGRGGGSIEDLWAFNEEAVARAIYMSKIPVISAVGHETDFTIADFVADLRAPTPSAAAELSVPSEDELLEKLQSTKLRLQSNAKKLLANYRLHLLMYAENRALRDGTSLIYDKQIYLDQLSKSFENSVANILSKKQQELEISASKLSSLSPLNTLSRGYSVTKNSNGNVIKSVTQVKQNDEISITLSDGQIEAIIR